MTGLRFASCNGTAPLDASSGEQTRHRLARAGNRRINRALHVMAVVRNPTEGRTYFDAKKAAGNTSTEAMRPLKRRLSNVVYAHTLADQNQRESTGPGGHSGTTLALGWVVLNDSAESGSDAAAARAGEPAGWLGGLSTQLKESTAG